MYLSNKYNIYFKMNSFVTILLKFGRKYSVLYMAYDKNIMNKLLW